MNSLAMQLDTLAIDNRIDIPCKFGNGFIKGMNIDENFRLRCYEFKLNHDLAFKWLSEEEDEPNLKLVFFLDNTTDTTNNHAPVTQLHEMQRKAVLFSTDLPRSGLIPKNASVKRLVFIFSKEWLHENFSEASDKIREIVNRLVKNNQPTFINEEMLEDHYRLAHELISEVNNDNPRMIQIKSKSLILVNDFLEKIVSRDSGIGNVFQTKHYAEIIKAEKILSDQYGKPCPDINEVAALCNMSASTLQRNFKVVFGKCIQTYCLEKKLALGKSMLMSRNKSISEIAYDLGYDKVNSFSKAFKKQYGILPRDVNKIKSDVLFLNS